MVYDYIIVGAGSAGSVLADRLTRDGRSTVLLLEAGPTDSSPLVSMPKGFGKLLGDPQHAWHLPTEAEDGIPAEVWARGKLLGGSSSINGMMYFRGHPQDYEEWEALGAKGWGGGTMERAFRAIENHELGEGDGRGVGGPLNISVSKDHSEISDRLIAAAGELGVPQVPDLNYPDQEGIAYATRTIFKGRRQSATVAFLKPARKRSNLTVLTGVTVDRVLFEGRRACGVRGRNAAGLADYAAGREVILSAGALASPAILQRSGVGPAAHLQGLGIPVIHDAPGVGANLLEHRLLMMHYALNRPLSVNPELGGWRIVKNGLRYLLTRTGPLAAGSYDIGAFMKTHASLDRPDIEILMAPYGYRFDDAGLPHVMREHTFHMFGYPLRSRSQGSVMIRSADPDEPARIRPNYLSDAYDQQTSVAMFRLMRDLVARKPLAEVISAELSPGPEVESDEDIIAAFRGRGLSGYHACGTVAMGGTGAPVDEMLRVRGVEGLRVVDGSVMPTMVSSNTNGPIMAVGWCAADLILQSRN